MTVSGDAVPLATVVITTHDRPGYARRALRSALAQTEVDLEVIVVDDGSTPPFAAESDDPRLRVVRQDTPAGMCAARNVGLAAARGEWITFLDDDDVLAPDMLEEALAVAAASPLPQPVAVMTGMAIVTPDGTEVDRCRPPSLEKGEHYLLEGRGDLRSKNGLVVPTDLTRRIGGWDPQFEAFEADDFGLRLNLVASIQACPDLLYRMTDHGDARLTGRRAALPRDMERTLAKHEALFRLHQGMHARYMSTLGMYHLRVGNWVPAVRWCVRGVARDPRRPRAWLYAAAAVAGPHALKVARRLHPAEAGVSVRALTGRRVRKYTKRLANYPLAVAAAPMVAVTRALLPRAVPASVVERPRAVLVLSIYRCENGALVAPLVDDAAARGWDVRLWALDGVDPRLATYTVGASSGAKFPLLNELAGRAHDLASYDWVVVADDDVTFASGGLAQLLGVAERSELDLVQPAHVELSHRDNEITRRRPASIARRTTFVEIGPVFAVRGVWADSVVPAPECHTMGWGLELEWSDLANQGLRLGIADAVAVRHLRPAGKSYDWKEQHERLRTMLEDRGYANLQESQRTLAIWRPWHARPPWSDRRVS
jgi:glycosyltransferase involved in cell wall biosynthesis